jgi:calcineurin-like phosphoesterase family protein
MVSLWIERNVMSMFFISDTHFGHANIIKYSNRPFKDTQDMDEALIKNWNELVQPNDEVWHLGDFTFCNYMQFTPILRRLNGKINVVLGNHDQTIIKNKSDLLKSNLLNSVQSYREVKHDGQMIVLFHYGQRVWNKSHHGSIHLYGHSHGSLPPFGKSVDVGVDCKEITSEYRPIHVDEVISYMAKKSFQAVDHHDGTRP